MRGEGGTGRDRSGGRTTETRFAARRVRHERRCGEMREEGAATRRARRGRVAPVVDASPRHPGGRTRGIRGRGSHHLASRPRTRVKSRDGEGASAASRRRARTGSMEPRARLWGVGGGARGRGDGGRGGEGQTVTTSMPWMRLFAHTKTLAGEVRRHQAAPRPGSARTLLSGLFDNKSATIVIPSRRSRRSLARFPLDRDLRCLHPPPSWTLYCVFPPRPPPSPSPLERTPASDTSP